MSLCLACGLCCDRTLFTVVPLGEAEAARAATHPRLRVIDREDGRALAQPCAALEPDLRCAAYAERPRACRTYRCLLLIATEEGEVSLDEALAIVRETKADRTRERLERHFLGRSGQGGRS